MTPERRRHLVAAVLALCAGIAEASAAAAEPFDFAQIAPGVYAHRGIVADFAPDNAGDLANLGVIVGKSCVAVVDTGGSFKVGRRLRRAIEAVTPLPVCYVVNTHVHPDHLFGNAAFRGDKVEFIGHAHLPLAVAQRARGYAAALERNIGAAAEGTEIVAPTRTVADTLELDLGGRTIVLRAWHTAHTDNDLTVQDVETGTLFLSDLLFVEHTPVVDGSLKGWLAAIGEIRKLNPRLVVPGHGAIPAPWPQALDDEARYLDVLLTGVRAALQRNRTIQQAVDSVGGEEAAHWKLFDSFHRRNVTASFAELEWEN